MFLLDSFSVLQTFLSSVDDYVEDDLIIEYHIGHFSLETSFTNMPQYYVKTKYDKAYFHFLIHNKS